MQTVIVVIIVLVAAIYVGRIFYKGLRQKEACACGCTCCGSTDSCSEPMQGEAVSSQEPVDPTGPRENA